MPAAAPLPREDGKAAVPDLAGLYRCMASIRAFEEAVARLVTSARIDGFVHLSIGQEGVAAGVCAALRPNDPITSTHRGHGHCIAHGADPGRMMAELFGRADGYGGGRSGSMHLADPDIAILGANAIVGGGLPMAVGAAYASLARGTGYVVAAFFGEGAVATGVFHECLNLAALWTLPIVFVCERNEYAELTPREVHHCASSIVSYADPHGMPGVSVDGNDVLAVHGAAATAVQRARTGEGPTLLEARTYRWHGHYEGDPQTYRDAEEVAAWREQDPLRRLREHVEATDPEGVAHLDALAEEARAEVVAAVASAEALPPAPERTVTAHVYAQQAGTRGAGD